MPTRLTKEQSITVLSRALALIPSEEVYLQTGAHYANASGVAVGPHSPGKVKYSLVGALYLAGYDLVLPRKPPYPPQFITTDVWDLLEDIQPGLVPESLPYAAMVSLMTAAIAQLTGSEESAHKAIATAVAPKTQPLPAAGAKALPRKPLVPLRQPVVKKTVTAPAARGPSHVVARKPQKSGQRSAPVRRPQLPTPNVTKPRAPRASGSKR
jgi:hypothetical protein